MRRSDAKPDDRLDGRPLSNKAPIQTLGEHSSKRKLRNTDSRCFSSSWDILPKTNAENESTLYHDHEPLIDPHSETPKPSVKSLKEVKFYGDKSVRPNSREL